MFERKPKTQPVTKEEFEKIKESVYGAKPIELQAQESPKGTEYFIGKRSIVKEKKYAETKSGQVVELPEEIERVVVKEVYPLTENDLTALFKDVDETRPIFKVLEKMLTGEL